MLGQNNNSRSKLLRQVQNYSIQFNYRQRVTTREDLLACTKARLGQSVMYERLKISLFFECAHSSEGSAIPGDDGHLPLHVKTISSPIQCCGLPAEAINNRKKLFWKALRSDKNVCSVCHNSPGWVHRAHTLYYHATKCEVQTAIHSL